MVDYRGLTAKKPRAKRKNLTEKLEEALAKIELLEENIEELEEKIEDLEQAMHTDYVAKEDMPDIETAKWRAELGIAGAKETLNQMIEELSEAL